MSNQQQQNDQLTSSISSTKRVHQLSKAETLKAKRAKVSQTAASLTDDAVEQYRKKERVRAVEVEKLRQTLLAQVPAEPAHDNLVTVCNTVRQLARRMPLEHAFAASIAQLPVELAESLIAVFLKPLTFCPAARPTVFKRSTKQLADTPDAQSDNADFYIRRLPFPSHDSLATCLRSASASKPQYTARIESIIDISAAMPESAGPERSLLYAGMTVASCPVGREAAGAAVKNDWSLIMTVEKLYKGVIEVYAVPPLSFSVGSGGIDSVKASREDPRLDLHESLLVDALGFAGLNIAPPGTTARVALSDRIRKLKSNLAAITISESEFPEW